MELKRRGMISEVLEAVGSGKRLGALEEITQGTPAKEIHEHIDASRSGVQHFINDFKDADLVTAPEDGQYDLTEKGEVVVDMLTRLDEEFKEFEVKQLRGMAVDSSLSAEEIEEILEDVRQEKGGG